jgi:GMP synthase PP-ATPase subunit
MAVKEEISCYDAIIAYCENADVEPEAVAPLVNKQLKEKLAIEFADMGLLKKQPSLLD